MLRLRLGYFAPIPLLVALLGRTVVNAVGRSIVPSAPDVTAVQRGTIQEHGDHWVVSYELTNDKQQPASFHIEVSIDGKVADASRITLNPERRLGYFYHVQPEQSQTGAVTLSLYEEGSSEVLDAVTYYLKAERGRRTQGSSG